MAGLPYGNPLPPDFEDGKPLSAAAFNAVKNYWVTDALPEYDPDDPDSVEIQDGDVVFVIGDPVDSPAPPEVEVEYLVVAGGGGSSQERVGNESSFGAGGAGGVLSGVTLVTQNECPVSVGAGGSAESNGEDSSFLSLTAVGGGVGGMYGGGDGGSGGGAGGFSSPSNPPGAGTPGQGNNGGTATWGNGGHGGGGGGAASAGGNAGASPGKGGDPISNSITGSNKSYGRGGTPAAGTSGEDNTGNGASGTTGTSVYNGGSGIVIIRFDSTFNPTIDIGLTYTRDTTTIPGKTILTFTQGIGDVIF